MATAVAKAYEVISGEVIYGGRYKPGPFGTMVLDDFALSGGFAPPPATYTLRQVETNGIITPGSFPSAVYRNGSLYHGWVDSSGNSGITKYTAPSTLERVILSTSTEYNSHNNVVVDFDAAGRINALWSKHNSDEYLRRRKSTNVEDVDPFDSIGTIDPGYGVTSYVNLWRLSQTGKLYAATRAGGSNPRPQRVVSSSDGTTWDAGRDWITDPADRPYPRYLSDGVSRVHMVFTTGNPAEVATQLHYAYMQLDGSNVEKFYNIGGTDLGGPATPSNATLAASNTGGRCWVYDLAFGPDGELWCLFYKFPTTSDQRLMFVKTTGGRAAWGTPVQIAAVGGPLYEAEPYSHAGAVFDSEDPTTVWACLRDGTYHEVFKVTTADNGASWTVGEQCTSGSSFHNFQIVSPLNHGGNLPWIACYGTYTYWSAGYSTQIRGWVKD